MKDVVKILMMGFFLSLLSISCSKAEQGVGGSTTGGETGRKEAVITGTTGEIGCNEVDVNGFLNVEPGVRNTVKFGIIYSTDSNPTRDNGTLIYSSDLDENSKFSVRLTGLTPGVKYYYKAFVKYESGTFQYGKTDSFTTLPIQASVTAEASNVSCTSATISGKLTVTSAGTFSKFATLYYSNTASTLDALKSSGMKKSLTLGADGSYSIDLSLLVSNTQYNYVVVSKVDEIELTTEVKSFTTPGIKASVTAESSNVSYHSTTISGKLTVESEGTFTKSVTLYYSSTANTMDALKSSGMKKTISLNADGTYSVVADYLSINTKHYYCVIAWVNDGEFSSPVKSLTTLDYQTPDLIDLGLSVKWASCNLGASKPESYGGYYQWAGTNDVTDKSIYLNSSNCPYHTGSNWTTGWTKYVPSDESSYWSGPGSPDNKTVLDPEDDVAHVKLGGKWRMPTDAEWTELRNNCTWTWTSNYNGMGVAGRIVTSNKPGYTDKSIFLPAAGSRRGDYLYDAGSYGSYSSSSLATVRTCDAYGVDFRSGDVGRSRWDRYYGSSVRPVSE